MRFTQVGPFQIYPIFFKHAFTLVASFRSLISGCGFKLQMTHGLGNQDDSKAIPYIQGQHASFFLESAAEPNCTVKGACTDIVSVTTLRKHDFQGGTSRGSVDMANKHEYGATNDPCIDASRQRALSRLYHSHDDQLVKRGIGSSYQVVFQIIVFALVK